MHGHENRHAQPANAVQDKRQLGTFSPVAQACPERDVPIQAHLSLLDTSFCEIVPLRRLRGIDKEQDGKLHKDFPIRFSWFSTHYLI
jgi:hypothetical protein